MEFEQLKIDVTLEGERELKENMQVVAKFALEQFMQHTCPSTIKNRHEGYGVAAEHYSELLKDMKSAKGDMDDMLKLLPISDGDILNVAGSLYNSSVEVAIRAIKLAAQSKRIIDDLYYGESKTPIEQILDELESESEEESNDGFEDAPTPDTNEEEEELDGNE